MKKVVIFDLDDTLIPSSHIYESVYQEMNLAKDAEFLAARKEVKEQLPNHTSQHHRLLYLKKYLERKSSFSAADLLKLNQEYEDRLTHLVRQNWESSGKANFLKSLKKEALFIIATNETTRTQLIKLNVLDPQRSLFDLIVTSEEVGCEKASPAFWDQILLKLKNLGPVQVWSIGDSVPQDLIPALNHGWKAVLTREFLTSPPEAPRQASVIDHLTDFSYD